MFPLSPCPVNSFFAASARFCLASKTDRHFLVLRPFVWKCQGMNFKPPVEICAQLSVIPAPEPESMSLSSDGRKYKKAWIPGQARNDLGGRTYGELKIDISSVHEFHTKRRSPIFSWPDRSGSNRLAAAGRVTPGGGRSVGCISRGRGISDSVPRFSRAVRGQMTREIYRRQTRAVAGQDRSRGLPAGGSSVTGLPGWDISRFISQSRHGERAMRPM